MTNKILKFGKTAIMLLIVVLLFVLIVSFISIKLFKENFVMAVNLLKMITIESDTKIQMITPVLESNVLINRPIYGSQYAMLKIESIDISLPIFFGESFSTLKSGIGQDSRSYFPGEGGSIIYMGHNFKTFLRRLPEASIGDTILIETEYGDFEYIIYDTKVINETNVEEVPIQQKEEILMIYTCWPINNVGYAYERYVVYAK